MIKNSKVNIMNGNIGVKCNQSNPTLSRIYNWLENTSVIINENDFDTCKDNLSNQNNYWEAYNTYVYEFENC